MKNQAKSHTNHFKCIYSLVLILLLLHGSAAFGSGSKEALKNSDITDDGLTVVKASKMTKVQIKDGINWSEYTKYQIAPVEVSFRANWQRDQNRNRKNLSARVTEKDMTRIREGMAKIVFEEFDAALQKKGGLTKVDQADSNTLLFKAEIINLDVYAPDVQTASRSTTYVTQAGRATLFLEVYDAVSGELLARWVDTREDPDKGYFGWANRITNTSQAKIIVKSWVKRLIEGLDNLKVVN